MSEGMVRLSERRPENGQRVRVSMIDGVNRRGALRSATFCGSDVPDALRLWRFNDGRYPNYYAFAIDDDLWMPEESDA